MQRRTLLAQLLRAQAFVVVATALVLLATLLVGGAILVRASQNAELRANADNLCRHALAEAGEERKPLLEAAQHSFGEDAPADFAIALLDAHGNVVTRWGHLPGWPPAELPEIQPGGFTGVSTPTLDGSRASYRVYWHVCAPEASIQLAARDVFARYDVQLVFYSALGAVPIALIAGLLIARRMLRRYLRPLHSLTEAARQLDARSDLHLGVNAPTRELSQLEQSIDELARRLGDAVERERRFTQDASHQLRTPLTVLRAAVERLREQSPADWEGRSQIATMLSELDALDRLTSALLVLARAEQAPPPRVAVNVCDLAREVAQERVQVDGPASPQPEVRAPDEILVRGSEELLRSAVANLLENSRKYGGRDARIRITVSAANGTAQVAVEDDGPGIPPDVRPHVFDRFFRAKQAHAQSDGAGLGLAVVRSIVAHHGGTVVADSSEMGGARMTIQLPAWIANPTTP